jgi:hypothetical protein
MLLSMGGGCNRGKTLDLQAVSGKVTLDSRALDNGNIQFSPKDAQGLLSGSVIVAGEYRIPREKGLPPGKYTVQISSALPGSAGAPVGPPGAMPPPLKERIPEKYNSMSQLNAEIKSGGGNTLDFDLSSHSGKK